MRQPIDLVGGFYTDESLPWSVQDTVNYLPVAAEAGGTRTPTKLVDAPGLRPFVAIGNTDGDPTAGAPIRGLHDVEGRLFVVSGQMLYEISQKGVAIPRGTIPGVGRVSMAHNQRGHGHELLVVNGSGGYVYNTATDNFTIVTDPGYPGAGVADFLDGYLMQVEPFGRFLFHSDLADALEYNTLDRFEAETQPDRVVGMIVNHQEVWAFGDRTIDVFGNVGTATGTFQNKGVSISRGCIAKWSPAIIDNGVAWLGDDRVVYHARGYDPVRISTRAIEVALSQCSLSDIRNAFSFVWSDRGHSVYYLTVPNGLTFGYDFSTGLWHRRASWHPERDIGGRWCLSDLVRSNGRWVGGDFRDGRLYTLDWDYMLEGCDALVRERVSPVMHADGRRFTVDSVDLLYDTGGPESDCGEYPWPMQPKGPRIEGDAPDGAIGISYTGYSYATAEGDAPITSIELVSGSLPPGLSFSNGVIETGTPTNLGSSSFTIRVTDSNGLWSDLHDTIEIDTVFFAAEGNTNPLYISHGGEEWSDSSRSDAEISTDARLLYSAKGRLYVVSRSGVGKYTDDHGLSWHDVFGLQSSGQAVGMVYTGSRWVVATSTSSGGARVSEDGINFVPSAFPVDRSINSIACDGDVVLVKAASGMIIRSEDGGITWSEYNEPGMPDGALIYGAGKFVLLSYTTNKIFTSQSGKEGTWVERANPSQGNGYRYGLAYGNGVFVAATASSDFIRSVDGNEWELVDNLNISSAVVGYAPTRFVAIGPSGSIYTSRDGFEWVTSPRPQGMSLITAITGIFQ